MCNLVEHSTLVRMGTAGQGLSFLQCSATATTACISSNRALIIKFSLVYLSVEVHGPAGVLPSHIETRENNFSLPFITEANSRVQWCETLHKNCNQPLNTIITGQKFKPWWDNKVQLLALLLLLLLFNHAILRMK